MKISVDLTLTPLSNEYETIIKSFIKKIRRSGLTIKENPLSTHIYGDYDLVMGFLNTEIFETFKQCDSVVMNMKIFKSDRSNYVPTF
ncbi:MAG: hypothetical protein CMC53_01380 [Flavobacteriaceae bacterium]|nr:hypothetical protein [Flavobacteriaceae bacterium]|tara:strand:+ start:194 stop:454 length:261 start_codon:yes stop_codon:yes gene_type:complete